MADTKIGDLTQLAVTPATGDQFFISDISEADDNDKGKYITWGTIDAAIDTIITANADGFLLNIVEDTTPQLGGNLDVNGNSIVSASAGDISITPDTTGDLILDGLKWPQADGTANYVLETDGAGQLSWTAQTGGGLSNVVEDLSPQLGANLDVNGNSIVSASAGDISITPDTTGDLILDGLKWPQADGTANYVLETDGAGQLSWTAQTGGGLSNVVEDLSPQLGANLDVNGNDIVSVSNGDINITPNGTGSVVLDGLSWPQADGTANYVLETDGAGQLGWVAQSGGGGSDTLADIAANSTTTAHQTFALDSATSFIIEDSGGTDILTVDEATPYALISAPMIFDDGSGYGAGSPQVTGEPSGTTGSRYIVQPDSGNRKLFFFALPSGTQNSTEFQMSNDSDVDNRGRFLFIVDGATASLVSDKLGTGTAITSLRIGSQATGSALANINFYFAGSTQATMSNAGHLRLGDSTAPASSNVLYAVLSDNATNSVTDGMVLEHQSSGSVANGFGTAFLFKGETFYHYRESYGAFVYALGYGHTRHKSMHR